MKTRKFTAGNYVGQQDFTSDDLTREVTGLTGKVFWLLRNENLTCTELCVRLGIYRPTGCRIKRALEKAGKLREIRKRICRITRARASELTCNPDRFPVDRQMKLFGEGGAA